jgi:hypothetical protein
MMGGIILLDNSAELGQAMPERKDGNSVPALIMGLGHPRQTAYVKSLANVASPSTPFTQSKLRSSFRGT